MATPSVLVSTATLAPAPAKTPLGPLDGAAKLTTAPTKGLPSASVTVTARGTGKSLPSSVLWVAPTPAVRSAATPARSVSEKVATVLSPGTVAVTLKAPAVVPAVSVGLTAVPSTLVCTAALAPAPAKLAPAPAVLTTAKLTVVPATGSPYSSATCTDKVPGNSSPIWADWSLPAVMLSELTTPTVVLVSSKGAET